MKRIFCAKPLVATAIALGAVVAASAAHARSDVVFSIGVNAPVGYVAPAPVYVQPRPVYVQPQPVYVQPQPIYVQPQPTTATPTTCNAAARTATGTAMAWRTASIATRAGSTRVPPTTTAGEDGTTTACPTASTARRRIRTATDARRSQRPHRTLSQGARTQCRATDPRQAPVSTPRPSTRCLNRFRLLFAASLTPPNASANFSPRVSGS